MAEIIKQIGWRDLLDIAIVSVILYRLLLLVKGTKAARMLVGLVLLLAASVVARLVPLYTLDWLLQSFWGYIVIAIVVIFQPEIRRALAKMGETSFIPASTSAEEFKGLEEIVKAAVTMSTRKIGALIALQRETDLKDFIELGTPLDAKISKELLLSVFHPASPIHDGAVVIRGNRAVAAGCFLPVTLSSELSKALGTRHRAAIGLTEETDAVVVVVSEETGDISLSERGVLEGRLDMGGLRDRLTEMFTEKKAKK